MLEMIQKKRDRQIEKKKLALEEKEKNKEKSIEINKEKDKSAANSDDENSADDSKSSHKSEDNKDFQFYGDEDLYYKEEKLEKKELEDIKDKIKNLRIKLIKFFNSESETINDVIKKLKPKPAQQKKSVNIRKNKKTEEEAETELKNKNSNLSLNENNNNNNKINEENFKELLDLISQLTELSHFDVYYDSYNKIVRDYGEKPLIKWKYRIVQNNEESLNEYGEFSTDQIKDWNSNVILNVFKKLLLIFYFEFQFLNNIFLEIF